MRGAAHVPLLAGALGLVAACVLVACTARFSFMEPVVVVQPYPEPIVVRR